MLKDISLFWSFFFLILLCHATAHISELSKEFILARENWKKIWTSKHTSYGLFKLDDALTKIAYDYVKMQHNIKKLSVHRYSKP